MKYELNKIYFATNSYNVDFEFFIASENETQYFIKFRKMGTDDWREAMRVKDKVHDTGIARYKAKYSKLGKALL